jgi:hypothetical protein
VQFVPIPDQLTEEATYKANILQLDDVTFHAFAPEYLVAVMLKTGRLKDFARAKMFLDQGRVDPELLGKLIDRFDLRSQWQKLIQF